MTGSRSTNGGHVERDTRLVWVPMDGRGEGQVPAWMVEKLYARALERGDTDRADMLLERLTRP